MDEAKRNRGEGERRPVLELVVGVIGAVERFARKRADAGGAEHLEIHEIAPAARDTVDDRRREDDGEESDNRPGASHTAGMDF